jgi:hypothetical protein
MGIFFCIVISFTYICPKYIKNMGLDTSHGAWSGGYGTFNTWRHWVAEQFDIPLELMEGFYKESHHFPNLFSLLDHKFPLGTELEMLGVNRLRKKLPLKWSAFKPSPIHKLLYHSDCDGYINWKDCGKIACELRKMLLRVEKPEDTYIYDKTMIFIEGCELAYERKEKLTFG